LILCQRWIQWVSVLDGRHAKPLSGCGVDGSPNLLGLDGIEHRA
jgi:hypothetical protein